jgi:Tfp pilus assembly protein PilZ
MASGADKRKYPRVQARNVSAHLNVADRSSPCVIANISAGGVFIETREALPVGMPVAVNLARPGWPRVLKVTGRVVWALAEKTAARKGTVPGMRIKFDPLPKEGAGRLQELLKELGAPDGPPPPTKRDSITEPVGIKQIQARLSESQFPLVRAPDTTPPHLAPKKPSSSAPRPSAPEPAKSSAPRLGSSPRLDRVSGAVKPNDTTLPARVGDLAPVFTAPANEAPRLIVQVQGLLMQLGDLQQQLEAREREVASLRQELSTKEEVLAKTDRELKAAELAIQRLSMKLAARK